MGRLAGRVTIVTGAASGIGLACALRFAQEGSTVVGCDITPTDAWDRVESATLGDATARFRKVDVRDERAQVELAAETASDFGRIDSLVRQLWDFLVTFSIYPRPLFAGALKVLLFTVIPAGFIGYLPVEIFRSFSLGGLAAAIGGAACGDAKTGAIGEPANKAIAAVAASHFLDD